MKNDKYWSDYEKAENERADQEFWEYVELCDKYNSIEQIEKEYNSRKYLMPFKNRLQLAIKNGILKKPIRQE